MISAALTLRLTHMLIHAIGRPEIADYVSKVILIYTILIFIRIIISWIPRIPYNRTLQSVLQFIHDITEPYLKIFRRLLPPLGGSKFAIDLSPMIGLLVLVIVGPLVVSAIAG